MPTGDEWGWAWLPDSDAGWVLLLAAECLLLLAAMWGFAAWRLRRARRRQASFERRRRLLHEILDERQARRYGYIDCEMHGQEER